MQAWLINDYSGIDQLRLADLPDPTPATGEVLLRVQFAALNPADRFLAEGQYPAKPPMPHILGRDGIGTIESIGPGVTNWSVGQRAMILRGEVGVQRAGTFAQKAAVPADTLTTLPPGWTDEQCAGASLVLLTAYQALTQWPDLPPSSVVLVTGASGGVGVATIQLAHAMGHTTVALTRSQQKGQQLRTLGADFILDPQQPDWTKSLRDQLGNRRVDLIVDSVAGPLFNDLLDTLGQSGRISVVGRMAGPVPQFNPGKLFFKRLKIGGVAVASFGPQDGQSAWSQILSTLSRTHAHPIVDQIFPFNQLPQAFARLSQSPLGKVILRVAE